jgi:hypothetical protein
VKGILDGLVFTDGIAALEAFVQPPVLDTLDGPKAYVWGGHMSAHRQSMPRINTPQAQLIGRSGFKRLDWNVDVYLSYEMNPDVPATDLDQDFPLILDTTMSTLWTTPMPVFIDPQGTVTDETGFADGVQYTQILSIGEEFDLEYPPERVPATMRMLYYTARFGLNIYEAVQA